MQNTQFESHTDQSPSHDFLPQLDKKSKFKVVASVFSVVFLVASVFVALILVRQGQDIRERAAKQTYPDNEQLLSLRDRYSKLSEEQKIGSEGQTLVQQMIDIATLRKSTLEQEVQDKTARFVSHASLHSARNTFPEAVREFLEEYVYLDGYLATGISEYPNGSGGIQSGPSFFYLTLETGQPEKVIINMYPTDSSFTSDSQPVYVEGIRIANRLGFVPSNLVPDENVKMAKFLEEHPDGRAPTARNENVVALLVNFQNDTSQPVSKTSLQTMFTGGTKPIRDFIAENSEGALTSDVMDVKGYYTLPFNSTGDCWTNFTNNWKSAIDAAAGDLSQYKHRIYVFPQSTGCHSAAYGVAGNFDNYTTIFIALAPFYTDKAVYAHELAHEHTIFLTPDRNSMKHANFLNCVNTVFPTSGSTGGCQAVYPQGECTDHWTNLGCSIAAQGPDNNLFHFNSAHKIEAGIWELGTDVQEITQSGTYNVYNTFATQTPRAIRIRRGNMTGANSFIYVSYRKAQNYDSNLPSGITQGGHLHLWNDGSDPGENTWLLDSTPSNSSGSNTTQSNSALVDNQVVSDTVSNISIRQVSHDANKVVVQVTMNATPVPPPTAVPNNFWLEVVSSSVELHWSSVPNAASYKVERCRVQSSGGCPNEYTEIANSLTTAYTDNPPNIATTTYKYRVRAVNSSGAGPYTEWIATKKRLYLTLKIVCQNGANPTYPTLPNGPISMMGWYSRDGMWAPGVGLDYTGTFYNTPSVQKTLISENSLQDFYVAAGRVAAGGNLNPVSTNQWPGIVTNGTYNVVTGTGEPFTFNGFRVRRNLLGNDPSMELRFYMPTHPDPQQNWCNL